MQVKTTFAPTGNLVPAVWLGSAPKAAPKPSAFGQMPKAYRIHRDVHGRLVKSEKLKILEWIMENPDCCRVQIAQVIACPTLRKRLAYLLARGFISEERRLHDGRWRMFYTAIEQE